MQKSILLQIKNFTDKQLYTRYKILVNSDGTVYDKRNKCNYQSLVEWANLLDKPAIDDTIAT